jgi:uncharacterized membrane protein (DUF485 family)
MHDIHHEDHPHVVSRNARYGLVLFAIYVLMYGGFIFLSVFMPHLLRERPFGGVNLAIIYGFGLIAAALVLAVFYMWLCRKRGEGSGPRA